MATFSGTTQKCKACEKTVYLVDQLTADSKIYHRFCFRCHHCKGTLKLSNYCSFEGVLYCKPHYDQLLKKTGSLDKSFEGISRTARVVRSTNQVQSNGKVCRLFVGTQEKCVTCKKTVYPIETVAVDGKSYHKICFRCCHGGCVISPSNYVAHEHRLYCRHHHTQLFKQKGNFSQLDRHENRETKHNEEDDDDQIKHKNENSCENGTKHENENSFENETEHENENSSEKETKHENDQDKHKDDQNKHENGSGNGSV